ncbi:MAG TPA: VacJ family lipoprotein [Candidatus Aquabacterium excrementipullorum]|nr:VacJ family lipoprotein [Candidatus Aquabacterium excrementipullorum]
MRSVSRACMLSALVLSVAVLQGCATAQNRDPLESLNRKVFSFNETVDDAVLKPVATGYVKITPKLVRTGVSNFVNNIKDVWSAINLVLQGRPGEAAQEVLRVSLNSTLGLAGFIDIARPMGLDRHNEDFGQTLAVWGVPQGAYLVLPFLGPSTTRDVADLPGNWYFSPSALFREPRDANAVRILTIINARAEVLSASNLLGDIALDRYAFLRDAYLQRRLSLVYNGDPPEEDDNGVEYDNGDPTTSDPATPQAPVQPQSLLLPEVEPGPVIWRRDLALADDLAGSLTPSSLAGQVLAAPLPSWMQQVGAAENAVTAGGANTAKRPTLSENKGFNLSTPTLDELRGLRADVDAR